MTDYVVERRATRSGMPAAWWGMMILIASEGTLFAAFIGTYFYLRFQAPHWPPDGVSEPAVALPLIMVGVLLASSIPMQLGSIAARAGRLAATRFYVFVALVVQAGYFAYEAHDFANQVHRTAISVDAYTLIYYTLLGADHAHVFLGLLLDLWLLAKLARGLTTYRVHATQAFAWYWHAVNLLTLIVIGTLLSAAVG